MPKLAKHLVVAVVVGGVLAAPAAALATHAFTDVPDDSIYAAALKRLTAAGVVEGCTSTAYCPQDDVTRGQLALLLDRLSGTGDIAPSVDAATVMGFTPEQLRGQTGAAGADGATGATGAAGERGAAGPRGSDGTPGAAGATGAPGAAGEQGAAGPQGSPGTPGAAGQVGPRGPSDVFYDASPSAGSPAASLLVEPGTYLVQATVVAQASKSPAHAVVCQLTAEEREANGARGGIIATSWATLDDPALNNGAPTFQTIPLLATFSGLGAETPLSIRFGLDCEKRGNNVADAVQYLERHLTATRVGALTPAGEPPK
jgi:hypothetical protein